MGSKPTAEEILRALRAPAAREATDEAMALLCAAFVEAHSPLPLTDETLAAAMLMLAGRRVTVERAEHLLTLLAERGEVEPDHA